VSSSLRDVVAAGKLAVTESGRLVAIEEVQAAERAALASVAAHHRRAPLDPGIPREHLRGEILPHAAADVFRLVLSRLDARGALVQERDVVRLPGFVLAAAAGDADALAALEASFRDGGLNPPSLDDALGRLGIAAARAEPLLAHLVRQGRLRRIGGTLLFHEAVLEELCERVRALPPARTTLSVGEFKDLVGTSRKFAIPLLEHLDARRVTARAGDVRRILPRPAR
jgi:selenocysteine-specific elongation factor